MSKEMELKLRCAEAIGWVRIDEVLDSLSCARLSEISVGDLHNTYFDTSELDLHRQKVALRIRKKKTNKKEGEGKGDYEGKSLRYIQTLKTAGQSVNGLSQRGEWEWELPSDEGKEPMIDTGLLESVDVWVGEVNVDASELVPIFTTDFQRTAQMIAWAGYRFELVLDQGEITVPGREETIPIKEIEIEYCGVFESGNQELAPEDALRALGQQLCAKLSLQPEDASKAQRGYALFRAS